MKPNPERLKEIKRLMKSNYPKSKIAVKLKTSRQTIGYYIKKYKLRYKDPLLN